MSPSERAEIRVMSKVQEVIKAGVRLKKLKP